MSKQQTVGGVPGNVLGMLSDLTSKLQHGSLTPEELGRFLRRENPFATADGVIADWQALYTGAGIECDVSSLVIPTHKPGFDRLIVVPKGLTLNRVVAELRKQFNVWTYHDDLDATVTKNDRAPTGTYAVWVRDRVEADEELKELSANDLEEKNILGTTLLERLCFEWKYFSETDKHLDREKVTLCSGSRYEDGGVPVVSWDSAGRRLIVNWYYPGDPHSSIRGRAVVS